MRANTRRLQTPASEETADTGLVVTHDNGQVKVRRAARRLARRGRGHQARHIIFTIDKEPTYEPDVAGDRAKMRGPAAARLP